jgi:dATP pyrophosphohydrolase
MARAPFQVLVFPYVVIDAAVSYALFQRSKETGGYWQAIAGGGEGAETPLEAAKREAEEEPGISQALEFFQLTSIATIPFVEISDFAVYEGGPLVLPEYAFGVSIEGKELLISQEHDSYGWYSYDEAHRMLRWDSNKTALWELDYRIRNNLMLLESD